MTGRSVTDDAEDEGPRVVGAWRGELGQLAIGLPVVTVVEPRGENFAFLWVDPIT